MKRQFQLFLVAVQFLTRLPVPPLPGFEPTWLARSARYFPLVGALVGWMGVGTWWLSSRCWPPAVAVGVMICTMLLVTGAFHEDGFADVCDGFGGGTTPDAVLAIMKDSRVGAYGAIGVAAMLGMRWVSLASLSPLVFPVIVVAAQLVSRWCATGLICKMHYVRSDIDGKSKPLADSLSTTDWLLSGGLGALALLPFAAVGEFTTAIPWSSTLSVALLAAAVSTCLTALFFYRRIGGYTGDCLGAVQQLAELSFLLGALAVLGID